MTQAKANRFYYGWVIVGVALLASFFVSGARMSFGPAFKPMLEDFAANRGELSVAMSLNQLFYGFAGPVTGWLTDRYGAKTVVIISAALTMIGLLGSSFAPNLLVLYVSYGVFAAFGFSGTTTVPFSALITRWFRRKSGTALGLFTAGTPIGHMILVPLATYMILTVNWRFAYAVLGLLIAVMILPMTWRLIRADPKDMGLLPDGDTQASADAAPGPGPVAMGMTASKSFAQAIRTKPYWLLSVGWFTCGFAGFLVATHLMPFATDMGMGPLQAAAVLSLLGAFAAVGTLSISTISDRIGCRNPLAAIYFSRFLVFPLLLSSLAIGNHLFIYAFALIMGLGMLATFPLASVIVRQVYGQQSMGVILGTILLAHQVGAAAGVFLGGAIFDATGRYDDAFLIASGLAFVAGIATCLIKEERRPAYAPTLVPAE